MSAPIMFDKGDVQVMDLNPLWCSECSPDGEAEEGREPKVSTKYILLDFRNAGSSVQYGEGLNALYCEECAEEIAGRIRESLPDAEDEPLAGS